MADVLIRHCSIRVVRRGGWSWGAEPRALLDRVMHQVPNLIAAELERLLPDDDDEREIAAPVRLRIPLSLAMLRAGGAVDAGMTVPEPENVADCLAVQIARALRSALASEPGFEPPSAPPGDGTSSTSSVVTLSAVSAEPADPLGVLLDWARRQQLQQRLDGFSVAALRRWHDWIVRNRPPVARAGTETDDPAGQLLARIAAQWRDAAPDEAEFLRRRLTIFVAVEATAQDSLQDAAVRAAIERILPARGPPPDAPVAETAPLAEAIAPDTAPIAAAATGRLAALAPPFAIPPSRPRPPAAARFDIQIETALPFLLLGPLARCGYLDTAAAVFQAANATEALPLFAVSLAYKVLAAPAQGWLRKPSTITTAAALGLLQEAPPDSARAAMARNIADQVSPLDAVVAAALLDGHQPGTPLLLSAIEQPARRLLLSDADGAFPIASAPTVAPLLPYLQHMLHEIVLVAASAALPEVLAALDAAQLRFVTDAVPCRNENWRAVRGRPGEAWWSNDTLASDQRLAAAARRLAPAAEASDEFWQAIGAERPSVPRAANDNCDRALTLAAGLALGSIAWELWREREPTSPQLTLARFCDFGARVRVDTTSVRVSLPRGRRFSDLYQHGFLADVTNVPWFGGRVLSFASG
jgi:hypothetical protein